MNELWVARDMDGSLWEWPRKPVWRESMLDFTMPDYQDVNRLSRQIPATMFPGLRPGECRRLVLAEESSE